MKTLKEEASLRHDELHDILSDIENIISSYGWTMSSVSYLRDKKTSIRIFVGKSYQDIKKAQTPLEPKREFRDLLTYSKKCSNNKLKNKGI